MIVRLNTETMTVTYEPHESDKELSDSEIATNISTLLSVTSAHQAVHLFDDENSRLLYLFMLISNANSIIKVVDEVQRELYIPDDIADDFEDDPEISFETWEEFLRRFLMDDDDEDGEDY